MNIDRHNWIIADSENLQETFSNWKMKNQCNESRQTEKEIEKVRNLWLEIRKEEEKLEKVVGRERSEMVTTSREGQSMRIDVCSLLSNKQQTILCEKIKIGKKILKNKKTSKS